MGSFNTGGAASGAGAGALAGTAVAPGIGTAIGAVGGGLLGGFGGGKGEDTPDLSLGDIWELGNLEQEFADRAARRTMEFNLFDVFTPFGSQTFSGTPGTPDFRQDIRLTPEDQALLSQRRDVLGLLSGFGLNQARQSGDIFSNPILGGQDLADSAAGLERATFQRGLNLLQPEFDRERSRLENQLVSRGLPRDSEAFLTETDRLSRRQQGDLENLALSSVGAGRQEQSRLLQADLARRGGALNELAALASGPAGLPTFQATPNVSVGAPNISNAANLTSNMQLANFQNRQANQQANQQGLFDLASAAILMGGF